MPSAGNPPQPSASAPDIGIDTSETASRIPEAAAIPPVPLSTLSVAWQSQRTRQPGKNTAA